MKCVNGVWYYKGRSYATLREALAAVWPCALPSIAGKKRPPPVRRIPGAAKIKTRWIKSTSGWGKDNQDGTGRRTENHLNQCYV